MTFLETSITWKLHIRYFIIIQREKIDYKILRILIQYGNQFKLLKYKIHSISRIGKESKLLNKRKRIRFEINIYLYLYVKTTDLKNYNIYFILFIGLWHFQ